MVKKRNTKYRRRLDASMAVKDQEKLAGIEAGMHKAGLLDGDETEDEDDYLPEFVGDSSAPPSKSDEHKRFDIAFENLGLTLPSGVEIMKVRIFCGGRFPNTC